MLRLSFPLLLALVFLLSPTGLLAASGIRQTLDPAAANKGDTVLWTALTAASWQALGTAANVPRIDLRLPGSPGSNRLPNPAGEVLNATLSQLPKALPPASKIWAGEPTPAFLRQINMELTNLFPGINQQIPSPDNAPPHGLIAVSALHQRVKFVRNFYRARGSTMRFVSSAGEVRPVAFFGTKGFYNEGFSDWAVRIHSYTSKEEFVIELGTQTAGESLWIVRVPKAPSLLAHLEAKGKATAAPPPDYPVLTPMDVLQIPCLDFSNTTDLSKDLSGSFIGNAGNAEVPYRITGCRQWIDFSLDETGARLKATTKIEAEPFGEPPAPPPKPKASPRQFICDGPFAVLLWREGAAIPYAAFHLDGGKWN
jgi:hypothetical protein